MIKKKYKQNKWEREKMMGELRQTARKGNPTTMPYQGRLWKTCRKNGGRGGETHVKGNRNQLMVGDMEIQKLKKKV